MIKRLLGHKPGPTPPPRRRTLKPGSSFYFKAHDLNFFESRKWSFPLEIVVWRSVNVWWLRTYAHPNRMGRLLLSLLCMPSKRMFPAIDGAERAVSDVYIEEIREKVQREMKGPKKIPRI